MDKCYNGRIDNMINNLNDVGRYLLSNPFTNDSSLNFNRQLSDDYFFEYFFSTSPEADQAKDDIYSAIIDNMVQIVLITGYKGCGKLPLLIILLI